MTDQSTGGRIRMVDARSGDTAWSWRPPAQRVAGWGRPSDVRRCRVGDSPVMAVCDSFGYVGVIGEDGDPLWSADVGRRANPHAVDASAHGRIAVAASTGGWVRLYDARSTSADAVAEIPLADAHGVVWDPAGEMLWMVGGDRLLCVAVTGPVDRPRWRVVLEDRTPSPEAHDLQPVQGSGEFWVTTRSSVYRYSPAEGAWSSDFTGAEDLDRPDVKSIGTHPGDGTVIQTVPASGLGLGWVTDTIDVFGAGHRAVRTDAWIYKARFWADESE
ncbi:DUF6528 family protein [Nocardioides sp. YIM 152315]|nr:DUF6528 family protein [Nocardioides sp. YIM 152315]MDF1602615.1 DUF6528 family protein [Nocardioides sp. YIM 152315]